MSNQEIISFLRENDLLLNVYVNEGMYITRIVEDKTDGDVLNISSRNTLAKSIESAVGKLMTDVQAGVSCNG